MRGLIVTADDFGLDTAVNEAVEQGHRSGILNAASLMVAAPAAADALARARRLPALRVGLHLVLADGASMLPPAEIPDLVDARGRFGDRMARDGARFFFLPRVRRQLAREIRAQFEAFAATGLILDHVNAHKHFHLHPTVLSLILSIGAEFGLRSVRLPADMDGPALLSPWLSLMRRSLRRRGIFHNDRVLGMAHSGSMNETMLLRLLRDIRPGVTELYLHPASRQPITESMPDYQHVAELAALLSPAVRELLESQHIVRGGFSDLATAFA